MFLLFYYFVVNLFDFKFLFFMLWCVEMYFFNNGDKINLHALKLGFIIFYRYLSYLISCINIQQ